MSERGLFCLIGKNPERYLGPLALLTFTWICTVEALPELERVKSVKSLTRILSLIENEHGDKARFVTLPLQTHLEDVYISQGTEIVLKPRDLSSAIAELFAKGISKKEAKRVVLRRYQDGEFHEK